ncbi:MAG: hypothetical protein COU10_02705 [Candidatus Harrisonbacteria bacterium CG10_big_fil_rev_8_21_14_0_10_45_28]|uniref:AAA+ ATPase domain-containing protein n=1 Tax=Candidatus Harrisonbacteria bacterium CG10_big_fil_rev_8_21_14_0_10_45_28 TaxID=1974586 RepID=A0A2H0UN36_9BACT|nr:MAG: hypothetical protein COU10_02705 [Candidatus Harrisonbacteria bacterium CG10_big_fil_rev_8_21_14_0_10_45_28]
MTFQRKQKIEDFLSPKRVLIIYGPRRIGKTTLLKQYLANVQDKKIRLDNGDDLDLRRALGSQKRKEILDYARPYDVIAIDEAQQIPNIGLAAKMMIDEFPGKIIILTGSSSFDLSQQAGEPLTGRHYTLTLLPIAQSEIGENSFQKKQQLEDFLIFGLYPEILSTDDRTEKIRMLRELVSSYLFKDILALDRLRSPELLLDITKCLAFQVGNEVSLNEIARTVKSDVKTVQRYVDVLEKSFVVKKIRAYSTNQRNEIAKQVKYYFYDTGVRNALIGAFNAVNLRDDVGALWENFIFMELYKKSFFGNSGEQYYFWRTKTQREIDIITEAGGKIKAYECKFSRAESKNVKAFTALYPNARVTIINKDNYLDFI